MAIEVAKIVIKSVQDAAGLEKVISKGQFTADEVIAVIGKTEGNGGVNDFTRILSDQAFRKVLRTLGSSKNSAELFSRGSENSGKFLLISAAIRALNTRPSNSEFDARRFAPCTPEQAVSPHANKPLTLVRPSRSTRTPPDA